MTIIVVAEDDSSISILDISCIKSSKKAFKYLKLFYWILIYPTKNGI